MNSEVNKWGWEKEKGGTESLRQSNTTQKGCTQRETCLHWREGITFCSEPGPGASSLKTMPSLLRSRSSWTITVIAPEVKITLPLNRTLRQWGTDKTELRVSSLLKGSRSRWVNVNGSCKGERGDKTEYTGTGQRTTGWWDAVCQTTEVWLEKVASGNRQQELNLCLPRLPFTHHPLSIMNLINTLLSLLFSCRIMPDSLWP